MSSSRWFGLTEGRKGTSTHGGVDRRAGGLGEPVGQIGRELGVHGGQSERDETEGDVALQLGATPR